MGVKLFYQLATHLRPAPDPKAFAIGATRNSALVAVSAGLLNQMNEVEAVLAHEIGHVANNDMVTLALIQGVVNTFVVFLSRIIGHVVDRTILGNRQGHGIGYFITSLVAQVALGILASTIVCWFSRQREFRADAAGAKSGNLARLFSTHSPPEDRIAALRLS